MSLPDRIDPRPARRIYRWDLDKTYLQTEFDTFGQLFRTAMQKAHQKVAVPGASALIKELRASGDSKLCIVSGSPKQMRAVLEEKLKLDGIQWDEFVLKDSLRNLMRGRFRALRGQVGYKLPALLESRAQESQDAEEILFGDDAESDAFIYSLYADILARRVRPEVLDTLMERASVYPDDAERVRVAWQKAPIVDPVRRVFIKLDRLTPPRKFRRYGPRMVPIFNYFQAALVLLADGLLTAPAVLRVAAEMVQTSGYNLLTLSNSMQDLARRGLPIHRITEPLIEAINGPTALLTALRPVPDIVRAFTQRLSVLGTVPPPDVAKEVDYLALMEEVWPAKRRRGSGSSEE